MYSNDNDGAKSTKSLMFVTEFGYCFESFCDV